MPNWCSNKVTLTHKDPSKIKLAVLAFEDEKFCETFVPLPNGEWNYDFCVSNWGTKWEVSGEVVEQLPNQATLYFDSAWAPPIEVYRALCAAGYEVTAYYDEPGMGFCGTVIGDELDFNDDYHEYAHLDPDEVRDLIGEDLDEEFAITERLHEWAANRGDLDEDTEDNLVEELEEIVEEDRKNMDTDMEDERNHKLPPHTD